MSTGGSGIGGQLAATGGVGFGGGGGGAAGGLALSFVHPGILHTKVDLDRMKTMVANGMAPYAAGYTVFQADKFSSASYVMRGPFAAVARTPTGHKIETESDVDAAYQNAVMWAITGNRANAAKAIQILNAWAGTLTAITDNDILAASLDGFKFANAAEIIRYTNAGWSAADAAAFANLLTGVFYPLIKDFATFANGNWSTGCIKAMMAIAVFTDDRAMFNRAVNWYQAGTDNGSLTHYVINAAGQCQESGRDQTHTQLGLAHLAESAEVAWHQGLDLYGASGNRLLAGFEYTASYNLGNVVPFQAFTDTTGKYPQTSISSLNRGEFRPIYEMVYNHYQNRRGMSCPHTQQVAMQIRPEGSWPGADHPGFGTLLFTRPPGSP